MKYFYLVKIPPKGHRYGNVIRVMKLNELMTTRTYNLAYSWEYNHHGDELDESDFDELIEEGFVKCVEINNDILAKIEKLQIIL